MIFNNSDNGTNIWDFLMFLVRTVIWLGALFLIAMFFMHVVLG